MSDFCVLITLNWGAVIGGPGYLTFGAIILFLMVIATFSSKIRLFKLILVSMRLTNSSVFLKSFFIYFRVITGSLAKSSFDRIMAEKASARVKLLLTKKFLSSLKCNSNIFKVCFN